MKVFKDPAVFLVISASCLRFFGGFAIGAYAPQFYKRKFPDDNDLYSILNAFVVSFGGALSAFTGGKLADYFGAKSFSNRLRIPAFGALLGYPPLLLALYSDSFGLSILGLLISYIFAECWFGPVLSVLQRRVPAQVRGLTIASYLLFGSILGNLSPIIIGSQDDGGTVHSVQKWLVIMVGISYISCSIFFLLAATYLDREGSQ